MLLLVLFRIFSQAPFKPQVTYQVVYISVCEIPRVFIKYSYIRLPTPWYYIMYIAEAPVKSRALDIMYSTEAVKSHVFISGIQGGACIP